MHTHTQNCVISSAQSIISCGDKKKTPQKQSDFGTNCSYNICLLSPKMPLIVETISNADRAKRAATGFSRDHILLRPLTGPRRRITANGEYRTCFMPIAYRQHAEPIRSFVVSDTDCWILGLPKSGVAIVQAIAGELLQKSPALLARPTAERLPIIE